MKKKAKLDETFIQFSSIFTLTHHFVPWYPFIDVNYYTTLLLGGKCIRILLLYYYGLDIYITITMILGIIHQKMLPK